MYEWRKLSPKERKELLHWRKLRGYPWHRPPHLQVENGYYHLTAACFEHHPVIGLSKERLKSFCEMLLELLLKHKVRLYAWCVLYNHYHVLLYSKDLLLLEKALGRLHGKTSFQWNGEEMMRGRKVWHACADRVIRTETHFWATLNYIHHNPVHHNCVKKWQDWPFSSASDYLQSIGREKAMEIWRKYPIDSYGKGWDD